jgi:hypothetical protein
MFSFVILIVAWPFAAIYGLFAGAVAGAGTFDVLLLLYSVDMQHVLCNIHPMRHGHLLSKHVHLLSQVLVSTPTPMLH